MMKSQSQRGKGRVVGCGIAALRRHIRNQQDPTTQVVHVDPATIRIEERLEHREEVRRARLDQRLRELFAPRPGPWPRIIDDDVAFPRVRVQFQRYKGTNADQKDQQPNVRRQQSRLSYPRQRRKIPRSLSTCNTIAMQDNPMLSRRRCNVRSYHFFEKSLAKKPCSSLYNFWINLPASRISLSTSSTITRSSSSTCLTTPCSASSTRVSRIVNPFPKLRSSGSMDRSSVCTSLLANSSTRSRSSSNSSNGPIRSGFGGHVLSVSVKSSHASPARSAASFSSGTYASGRLRARVYTVAPPYPFQASFCPL
mmetsp:Transcript_14952/g.42566  ORF Transcript_14952/g.42566 Transcript_14952/m.42566 type:complete len:310 (-) Transcript_14952:937-1866(-)